MSHDHTPSLFKRVWLQLLAATGVIAAVGLNWWWKIEDVRTPDAAPLVSFGDAVEAGRAKLTPLSLAVEHSEESGGRFILDAELLNETGSTLESVFGFPPKLPELLVEGERIEAAGIRLERDGEPLRQLQPRLPERVSIFWEAPPEWTPGTVRVHFSRQTFKLRDNLYGQANWLGFVPSGELSATPELQP